MIRFARIKTCSAALLVAAFATQSIVACGGGDEPRKDTEVPGPNDKKVTDPNQEKADPKKDDKSKPGKEDGIDDAGPKTDADASDANDEKPAPPKGLQSISVTPSTTKAAKGTVVTLTVRGKYADGKEIGITEYSGFELSVPAELVLVPTSEFGGLAVHALAKGTAVVTVTEKESKLSASATIEVTDAKLKSLAITAKPTLAKGLFQTLEAEGTYDDGSKQDVTLQTAWSADPANALAFEPGVGRRNRVRALEEGKVVVRGTFEGQTGETTFEVTQATPVKLAFSAPPEKISLRTTDRLKVIATMTDNTEQDVSDKVEWTTSDPAVLLVDGTGLATAASLGKANITVRTGNNIEATTSVEVTEPTLEQLSLRPDDATGGSIDKMVALKTRRLKLVGKYSDRSLQNLSADAKWESDTPEVLSVDNGANKGLLTAKKEGKATLVVTYGDKAPVRRTITVTAK